MSTADAEQLRLQLATWSTWLDERTDRLLALEERCGLSGTANDEADVAAAFVARKAIGERLAAINVAAEKDRERAAAMLGQPLVDGLGAAVGELRDELRQVRDRGVDLAALRLDHVEQLLGGARVLG